MTESISNDTINLLHQRTSCRSFADKPIPEDVMQAIFEAGIHAPTGGNLQPYSIIRIEDKATSEWLARWSHQKFIGDAAVNLLFCIDWYRLKRWAELENAPFSAQKAFRHFWISFQDTIIAAQNISTAADALGVGSVYIGTIMEFFPELREMFQLPSGVFPVVLLCLGYPTKEVEIAPKLGVETIVHKEKYHNYSDDEIRQAFNAKYGEKKFQIDDERMARLEETFRKLHGKKSAKECIDRIKDAGYINMAQHRFGIHYNAWVMPHKNQKFLDEVKDAGFGWFEKFKGKV